MSDITDESLIFNIPEQDKASERKVTPGNPYTETTGSAGGYVDQFDSEFVAANDINLNQDKAIDMANPALSDFAAAAAKEQEEFDKSKRLGRPTFLQMLMSLGVKSNKSYLPRHVALPKLIENNNAAKNLLSRVEMEMQTYEKTVKNYEELLHKKGIDLNEFEKELLAPNEMTNTKKRLLQDPELILAMNSVATAGNRLADTVKSKEMKMVMGTIDNGELGERIKNDFTSTLNDISGNRLNALKNKKIPLIDKGTLSSLDEKVDGLSDSIKGVFGKIFSALFGRKM